MNLFELQERLKDFSQEQLVREMQAPTGSAPQYLVLSELQRRQRMMAEEQARMQTPQTTVAEDAIAAAGVPQGGLADMARSMAPQTDMDMNTAVQPVERMRDGGVVRMQPGGLAGISRDIRDFAPRLPAEIAGVRREDFMLLSPRSRQTLFSSKTQPQKCEREERRCSLNTTLNAPGRGSSLRHLHPIAPLKFVHPMPLSAKQKLKPLRKPRPWMMRRLILLNSLSIRMKMKELHAYLLAISSVMSIPISSVAAAMRSLPLVTSSQLARWFHSLFLLAQMKTLTLMLKLS
jgi:hypothetical protein